MPLKFQYNVKIYQDCQLPNEQIKTEFETLINAKYADKIDKINYFGGYFAVSGFKDGGRTLIGYLAGPEGFVEAMTKGWI